MRSASSAGIRDVNRSGGSTRCESPEFAHSFSIAPPTSVWSAGALPTTSSRRIEALRSGPRASVSTRRGGEPSPSMRSARHSRSRVGSASMITSIHLLIYSDDPPATRAFLRDVLGWPYVEDAGAEPGWPIFGTGRSEMGVHPTHSVWEGKEYHSPRHHQISLSCDDLEATMTEWRAKGAVFRSAA